MSLGSDLPDQAFDPAFDILPVQLCPTVHADHIVFLAGQANGSPSSENGGFAT
jgi:hypothetical protein